MTMVWLTWRQHRMQLVVTAVLLAGLGVFLLVHGMRNADLAAGLEHDRDQLTKVLGDRYKPVYQVVGWLPVAPALVGLFWGAPVLAREFERGTHRLSWTQSVSRRQWLAAKLGGLGLVAALGGLALGGMVAAWMSTFAGTRYADDPSNFMVSGVAAAGWWAFGYMLGVAAGAVLRRMLPAMAVTVAVFIVALIGVSFIRSDYAPPERVVLTEGVHNPAADGAYGKDSEWQDSEGRTLSDARVAAATEQLCPPRGDRYDYTDCLLGNGYREVVYYQPLTRYWRFQLTEMGLLLLCALALGAVAVRGALRARV